MSEWDKLWLNENEPRSWMGYVNDTAWILKVKTEGDKLQEEAEGHKARYEDLHRITMKWNRRLEAIREEVECAEKQKASIHPYTIRKVLDE